MPASVPGLSGALTWLGCESYSQLLRRGQCFRDIQHLAGLVALGLNDAFDADLEEPSHISEHANCVLDSGLRPVLVRVGEQHAYSAPRKRVPSVGSAQGVHSVKQQLELSRDCEVVDWGSEDNGI